MNIGKQNSLGITENFRRSILVFTLYFGALIGFAESAAFGIKKIFLGRIIRQGIHSLWMTPLIDILIILLLGVILYILTKPLSERNKIGAFSFVYIFLLVATLLSKTPKIANWAGALLAAGISYQLTNFVSLHFPRIIKFAGKTLIPLLLLIPAAAIGVYVVEGAAERQAIEALPAASSDSPNVLFIVLDTVRAESMSVYGYERDTTPRIQEYANQGIVFQNPYSTSPWTLPSHGTMFTGYLPFEAFGSRWAPLDNTLPTLAEKFDDHGYLTGGFIGNNLFVSHVHGLDRGFIHYDDYPISFGEAIRTSYLGEYIILASRWVGFHDEFGRKSAETITGNFQNWLETSDSDRPFFAFLNFYDAHDPYLPPDNYLNMYSEETPRGYLSCTEVEEYPTGYQELIDSYDGAINYLDDKIGQLLDSLKAQGILDNTLVIITSDHGELFGEHGLCGHANSLYSQVILVPLIIIYPEQLPANMRVETPVSLIDLPATVLDILNLEAETQFPGTSLQRFWSTQSTENTPEIEPLIAEVRQSSDLPPSPAAIGNLRSAMINNFHYIYNYGDGTEELYDLEVDPGEFDNLINSPNEIKELQLLRSILNISPPENQE